MAYYYDYRDLADAPFRPGTIFITKLTAVIKLSGATLLDSFLVFQFFSFIGVSFLLLTFREVIRDLAGPARPYSYLLLLLPGLHFWTGFVSKDALVFLGCALCVWGSMRIARRLPAFLLGLIILLPVRPHVAGIAVIALVATLTLDRRVRIGIKVPLLVVAIVTAGFILSTVQSVFEINPLDPDSVTDFIASRQEIGARREGGAEITALPLPLKILSLLFRPFFFDAQGALGWVVSIENIVLIIVFGTLIVRLPTLLRLSGSVVYVRYCLIFSTALIILLSLISYNVGLGLRQKFMAMPAVLLLYVTVVAYRRATAAAAAPPPQAADAAAGQPRDLRPV